MKLHTGDTIVVITGKDRGKQGRILRVLESQNRVVVEGINMRVRHIKKTTQAAGQRVKFEASIHASNVMILDPKTKKPTRIGYKVDAKTGAKKRVALLSGEVIEKAAVTKGAKPAKKSEAKKEEGTKAAKTPFWKRGTKGKGGDDGSAGGTSGGDSNVIQTAHRAQGG